MYLDRITFWKGVHNSGARLDLFGPEYVSSVGILYSNSGLQTNGREED